MTALAALVTGVGLKVQGSGFELPTINERREGGQEEGWMMPETHPIGATYWLALDTVSNELVRVSRFSPMPPHCFKVVRVKLGGDRREVYDTDGCLRPTCYSVRRWQEQPHALRLLARPGESLSATPPVAFVDLWAELYGAPLE